MDKHDVVLYIYTCMSANKGVLSCFWDEKLCNFFRHLFFLAPLIFC